MRELQAEYGVDRAIFIKTDVTNTAELEGNLIALLKEIRHTGDTGFVCETPQIRQGWLLNYLEVYRLIAFMSVHLSQDLGSE